MEFGVRVRKHGRHLTPAPHDHPPRRPGSSGPCYFLSLPKANSGPHNTARPLVFPVLLHPVAGEGVGTLVSMAAISKTAEHALIRKAKAGDGRAVEALIRLHQGSLYAFMLRMSGRPETAEDIVQEAFVRVLRNLDRFDSRFRFSTWLFTIAKRLYVNAAQKLSPSYDSDMVGMCQSDGCDGAMPGRLTARVETMDNVRSLLAKALAGLNGQQREIVLLFHQQNWPISAIAAHLHMPEGTVKSHLHRARKRMRDVIVSDRVMNRQAEEAWS